MEECPYFSISPENLEACTQLAKVIPLPSPMPQRWLHSDHILWKIGDWEVRRPLKETLLDVLIAHLKFTFGKPWADEQYALPVEQRHVVMRWWFSLCETQKYAAPPGHVRGQTYSVPHTGDVAELGRLADDLYRLRLAGALDQKVLERLRSHSEFQGARYEFAIAASMVRSGFNINWVHGTDTHCEFEATHATTKETIAVEVKSRRVRGTLNEHGEMPNLDEMRFIAHRYYNEALKQCPVDRPSAIFIDLNLPPQATTDTNNIPWKSEMQRMIDNLPQPSATEPAVETCLVFTNFAAHYSGHEQAPPQRYVFCFPQFVRHPLKSMSTFTALIQGIEKYGQIPMIE